MRAAQTALRRPMLPRRQAAERPRKESGEKTFDVAWLLGMLFLAGYLPGVWLGRGSTSALGQQLAAYYEKSPEEAAFVQLLRAQLAIDFLQLTAVFLCGFCVWGAGLLALLFAASVAAANGAAGLVQYRTGTVVSDVATLFLCLWLAGWSVRLARELFRTVQGRATRETPGTVRRLTVRFAAALVTAAVLTATETFLRLVILRLGH